MASGIPQLSHPDRYTVLAPLFKDRHLNQQNKWTGFGGVAFDDRRIGKVGPNMAAGLLTEPEAGQVLGPACECLKLDNRDVRKSAAAALQALSDKRALPALAAALKTEDADSVSRVFAIRLAAVAA